MTKITKDITNHPLNLFNACHLHPFIATHLEDILIFDIETTGLHHKHCKVILIGYLFFRNGQLFAEQIFAETPEEEVELLNHFMTISHQFSYHLSYNGNSFDIPFLNNRYQEHRINFTLDKSTNIDLLRVARKLSKTLDLENYKLKTVERFLGIYREDLISGKESVELYNHYLYSPSNSLRDTILLHNFEDIVYLGKVVDLLGYQDSNDYSNIPIKFEFSGNRYYVKDYKIVKDFMKVSIFSKDLVQKRVHFSPGQLTLEQTDHIITVKVPIFSINVEDHRYIFLDVDLITHDMLNFNTLSYDEKLEFLVDDQNIGHCLEALFKTIELY